MEQGLHELDGKKYLSLQLTVSLEDSLANPKYFKEWLPIEKDTKFHQKLAEFTERRIASANPTKPVADEKTTQAKLAAEQAEKELRKKPKKMTEAEASAAAAAAYKARGGYDSDGDD